MYFGLNLYFCKKESLKAIYFYSKKVLSPHTADLWLSFSTSLSSKLSDNLSLSVSYCWKDGLFMVQWSKYFAVEEHIHPPLLLKLKINDVILVCVFCKINDLDVAAVTLVADSFQTQRSLILSRFSCLSFVIYHIKASLKSHLKVRIWFV